MISLIDLDKDHATLCEWWRERGWPEVAREMLPSTGFMSNGIAAAFLYKTDSTICWMEWIIADPKSDKELRDQSLTELIEHMEKVARIFGFKVMFTCTPHGPFGVRLKKHDFQVGDSNSTTYIRRL